VSRVPQRHPINSYSVYPPLHLLFTVSTARRARAEKKAEWTRALETEVANCSLSFSVKRPRREGKRRRLAVGSLSSPVTIPLSNCRLPRGFLIASDDDDDDSISFHFSAGKASSPKGRGRPSNCMGGEGEGGGRGREITFELSRATFTAVQDTFHFLYDRRSGSQIFAPFLPSSPSTLFSTLLRLLGRRASERARVLACWLKSYVLLAIPGNSTGKCSRVVLMTRGIRDDVPDVVAVAARRDCNST